MKKNPVKIMTLDTETYNGLIGGLKRIAVYDGEKVVYGFTFKDVEPEILKYVKMGYKPYVYIHNLEFDLRKFINEIKEDIIWEKSFLINGKIGQVQTDNYVLQDSFKLLPMSLASLSGKKGFDVEHGKLDLWTEVQKRYQNQYIDIVDFLDRCDVNDPLFIEYLGYDVISLYEILQKVLSVSGLTTDELVKCITTASLSRYIFKHGYKGTVFKNPENVKTDYEILCSRDWTKYPKFEEFFRDTYYGGRCEVFNVKLENKGYHYDETSIYPFEMREKEFPVGSCFYFNDSKKAELNFYEWMETHKGLGFIACSIYVPYQNVPPLPAKMGKLVFPCGYIFGAWTYSEVEYAIKVCGCRIIEVRDCIYFKRTYKVFENFVNIMYGVKDEGEKSGNMALRTFGKLILNTGYGYTGMRRDKSGLVSIKKLEKINKDDIISVNKMYGYVEVKKTAKSKYIQVQIASYVTSYARLNLLRLLRHGDSKGNIYYCDTDSVVCDKEFDAEYVHPTQMGKVKLEGVLSKGLFIKPKVYAEVVRTDKDKAVNTVKNNPSLKNNFMKDNDGNYYEVGKKFKGVTKDTQTAMQYRDYETILDEIVKGENESYLVERGRITMRSISYMQKKDLPMDYYETRDKVMRFDNTDKRIVDYVTGRTKPYYFKSLDDFDNFKFTDGGDVEL